MCVHNVFVLIIFVQFDKEGLKYFFFLHKAMKKVVRT